MGDSTLTQLRRAYAPAPGLLFHDWGDSAAVIYVPGTHATHLVDATAAGLISDWAQPVDAEEAAMVALRLQAQLPDLVQAGILIDLRA